MSNANIITVVLVAIVIITLVAVAPFIKNEQVALPTIDVQTQPSTVWLEDVVAESGSPDPHVTCGHMVKISLLPPDSNVSITVGNKTYLTDANGTIVVEMCENQFYNIQTGGFSAMVYPRGDDYTFARSV